MGSERRRKEKAAFKMALVERTRGIWERSRRTPREPRTCAEVQNLQRDLRTQICMEVNQIAEARTAVPENKIIFQPRAVKPGDVWRPRTISIPQSNVRYASKAGAETGMENQ